MNCPYCGREMQPGVIQCRDGLYWSEKVRPVAAIPILGGARIDLNGNESGIFSGSRTAAYCCRACKKIVIDYEKPEDGAQ